MDPHNRTLGHWTWERWKDISGPKKKKSQQKSIKHLEISITRNVQDPCKHNNKANKQKQ